MKRYVKSPNTTLPSTTEQASAPDVLPDFDVDKLLAQSGAILAREIKNLMIKSSSGKLDGADARDLVAYIKLLQELKHEEQDRLSNMTDGEIAELLQKAQDAKGE